MKKISEQFIKDAAGRAKEIGTAARSGQVGPDLCSKMREWMELRSLPREEQVLRHMIECPMCMGAATTRLIDIIGRVKFVAMKRAIKELGGRVPGQGDKN